jgi:hypothetical protein
MGDSFRGFAWLLSFSLGSEALRASTIPSFFVSRGGGHNDNFDENLETSVSWLVTNVDLSQISLYHRAGIPRDFFFLILKVHKHEIILNFFFT